MGCPTVGSRSRCSWGRAAKSGWTRVTVAGHCLSMKLSFFICSLGLQAVVDNPKVHGKGSSTALAYEPGCFMLHCDSAVSACHQICQLQ